MYMKIVRIVQRIQNTRTKKNEMVGSSQLNW